jgi:zinc protease
MSLVPTSRLVVNMCRTGCRIGLAFAVLLSIAGARNVVAQQVAQVASVEGITEYALNNGLRVLLFPDQSKPTITVNITYFVGSRHEAYGETGMAHLLEHLVFKGTPNHPDIPQELTEHGASPNGTTWYDRTNYFETFGATDENLEWALDLEADRMVNSYISGDDLESEMTVVRNEMEMGENSPFGILMERTMSTMYLWHNYGNSTIGARSDVEDVPIERLQGFYRKYYQPDNAMLVVAGKFDAEKTLDLVVEKFGAIPRPDRSGANFIYDTYTREPTQDGERSVTLRRMGDEQLVMAMYHIPPGSHEHFPAVDVLAHALGDVPSGRLYKALVEPGKAASVGAFAFQFKEAGPLLLFAQVREEDSLDEAWEIMRATMDGVIEQPITDEEMERARTSYLRDIELAFNSSQGIALQLSEWAAMGDWRLFFIHRDRLRDLTTEEVNLAAVSYIKPSNRTVGFFLPTDQPDRADIPAAPVVTTLVADYTGDEVVSAGEVFDPSPDNVESRTDRTEFASGFKLAMLPKETRGDNVVATFRILFGTEESLMGLQSVGSLTGGTMMRGTTERSRQEVSDAIDALGARVGVSGSVTSASGNIQTTRENLPEVLRLVGEIMRQPAFDASEFDQLKEQRLAAIESNMSEPQALASIAFSRHMNPYPQGHPRYTPTFEEQIEAINAVTIEQVRQLYADFYGADRGHMAIVGDFDPAEIAPIVEEIFGDWHAESPTARTPTVYQDIEADKIVIETPDKANAMFIAGLNLPVGEDHEDYAALVMGNYMLGGGFLNSRLAVRIRQEEGLSYGVASNFSAHPVDGNGSLVAYAIYAPENAERLEAAFREEIDKVLESGFTPEEVEAAIAGYLQAQNVRRSNDGPLASTLSQHLYFGRTMEWDKELEAKIAALTPQQILEAMRRHIDPDKISIVMAGDFEQAPIP